jgi:hypothetical protein
MLEAARLEAAAELAAVEDEAVRRRAEVAALTASRQALLDGLGALLAQHQRLLADFR